MQRSVKWDKRFLSLAEHISEWSKDPSTKVGCVIVGPDNEIRATGYNGFPRGVSDAAERYEDRDIKYPIVCYAEENAIMNAARVGVSLKGCQAYVSMQPCSRCARGLIQVGLVSVVWRHQAIPKRWTEDMGTAYELMCEAGVYCVKYWR